MKILYRVGRAIAAQLRAYARPTGSVPAGVLRLTATGRHEAEAQGTEVVVLEARSSSGLVVDLAQLAERPGVEVMRNIWVGERRPVVSCGLKLAAGATLDLALGPKGRVLLRSHPWSGEVELETRERLITLSLFSREYEIRRIELASLLPLRPQPETSIAGGEGALLDHVRRQARQHLAALLPLRTRDDLLDNALAIYTPRWKGISVATRNLFRCTLPVPLTPDEHPDDIEPGYLAAIAEAVLEAGFTNIVFSGGDAALFTLARRLKESRPSLSIRLLWHGSYLQLGEMHDWRLFLPWLEGGQSRMIDRIAVVKPGMEKFLETLGVPSCYVQNIVPFDRAAVHPTNVDDVVGLWLSGSSEYRKRPYSALLALAGLPQFSLRASGLGELGCRMIEELGLRTVAIFPEPIPHERVIHEMRQTSLTLYVTLSECMPMVPLESISCGVPCIVGPGTRFYDLPYLTERLVVNDPTDPRAIRRRIMSVMDEYDEVTRQSLDFLDRLTEHAAEKLTRFLS